MSTAIEKARECAVWYRRRGWNPLPSRTDIKAPAMRTYSEEREGGIPDKFLEKWWTPNIQLATGVRWGLVAIDLDGVEAVRVWRAWASARGCPKTWMVRGRNADGSPRGLHLWFVPPADLRALPTTVLWGVWNPEKCGWSKGSKIELIGDHQLIVAPPSVHVKTGMPYEFEVGPRDLPRPSPLPEWVLGLVGSRGRRVKVDSPAAPTLPIGNRKRSQGLPYAFYDRDEVLGLIEDKPGLASEWAPWLVVQARPNENGWVSCRRDRNDRHPSASLHTATGVFWSRNPDESLSFYDLAVRLGAYPTAVDAINDLGVRFGAKPRNRTADRR